MISVTTDVIQQSVRRDHFIQPNNNNNAKQQKLIYLSQRGVSESDTEFQQHSYNKAQEDAMYFPKIQEADHEYEESADFSDNGHGHEADELAYTPIDHSFHKQTDMNRESLSVTNSSFQHMHKQGDDLTSFQKLEVDTIASPKVGKSALSFMINDNNNMADDEKSNPFDFTGAFEHGAYPRRHEVIPKGAEPPKLEHVNSGHNTHHHQHAQQQQQPQAALVNLVMIFSEFDFDKEIKIELAIHDEALSVEQVIADTVNQFEKTYPLKKLTSYQHIDYNLRGIDDDDLDDDDLDEDDLDPPLTRNAKICDFVVDKTPNKAVYMVMCCEQRLVASQSSLRGVRFTLNDNNNNNDMSSTDNHEEESKQSDTKALEAVLKRKRAATMERLAEETKAIFIRVYVPGPVNESAIMLSVDKSETNTATLRDLFSLLNRKRKHYKFNSQYFDFYYRNKTKQYGAISNAIKIVDLLEKELMILPKILSSQHADFNEEEAFQFELVRLANQVKQYTAFKIDKYRSSKKKSFLLEVDRYRFVKTKLETSAFSKKNKNQVRTPVPITDIVSVMETEKSNGHQKHHNQFTITYLSPNEKSNSKHKHNHKQKVKTYEMNSTSDRDEIVAKLRYLCILRKLQG